MISPIPPCPPRVLDGARLIERLPTVRGRLTPDAPLAAQTWFRTGGAAEALFTPADSEDLAAFLAACPMDIPITLLGAASNCLVRDGGVPGVVIRLGPAFGRITVTAPIIEAGAAAMDFNLARAAADAGWDGFSFLSGIPGTIGGALRMNAGAYGAEIKDIFVCAQAIDRKGQPVTLDAAAMGFGYRHIEAASDLVFISAKFKGIEGDPKAIHEKMRAIQSARATTQPVRERTGGSTFANPADDPKGRRAWELIDAAGCRGLALGGAMVSEQHCNFLINRGDATAADIEDLGETVRARVHDMFGVTLRWEIRRIGVPLPGAMRTQADAAPQAPTDKGGR